MIKTISILFIAGVLSGCAISPADKSWTAIGGSRSDGIIKLAYHINLFDSNEPPESQAVPIAAQRCKVWGYKSASPFGGKTTQCESRNSWGQCMNGTVIKEYQCTGSNTDK